jgi:hypothetical protein
MGLPPSDHDPSEVRDLADEILSQPRYDRPPKSIPDRILEWVGERISDLLERLVGGGGGTVIAWLILLAALGGIVFLLVRYGRVRLPVLPADAPAEVMVELARTAAEWRGEADALERDGRWAEGLRCRYRALVADLVRRGTIPEQAGRTAGEYVRDVAADLPDASVPFAAATELFEVVWYGGATTGPDEARRFADLDARVLGARVR